MTPGPLSFRHLDRLDILGAPVIIQTLQLLFTVEPVGARHVRGLQLLGRSQCVLGRDVVVILSQRRVGQPQSATGLAPKAISKRIRGRWINFATQAKPTGPSGEPEWTPYEKTDRACLIVEERDAIVHDIDAHIRAAWGATW